MKLSESAIMSIFSKRKIVPNYLMNLLGCQIGRILLAKALLIKRRRRWMKEANEIELTLLRDGVVSIDNFFDDATFQSLLDESNDCDAMLATTTPLPDKFGIVRQQIGLHKRPDAFPKINRALLNNDRLLHAIRIQEGWKSSDTFHNTGTVLKYEKLEQLIEPSQSNRDAADISSGDMHTDTFHFVSKAFLTLTDMTLENSPYTYCLGSQRLNAKRLAWEYKNSIRRDQYKSEDYYNRIYLDELKLMGFSPTALTAKPNTLIITDTFGFHLRGQMTKKGAVRRMLRMDFRSNPFRL